MRTVPQLLSKFGIDTRRTSDSGSRHQLGVDVSY